MRAAETVLEQVNPYVFAAYLDDHREYPKVVEIVGAIIQSPSEDLPHKAAALALWGGVLDDQKKYDEAIAKFQSAVELDPETCQFTYNNWGVALNGQRKYDEAIARFRKPIELMDTKHAAYPYNNWGEALRKQGKYDEAIAKLPGRPSSSDQNHSAAYKTWATCSGTREDTARLSPGTKRPSSLIRNIPMLTTTGAKRSGRK